MGQAESASVSLSDNPNVFDEDLSIRRRRRRRQQKHTRGAKTSAYFSSMYESGIDIDHALNNLGITSLPEESPLSGTLSFPSLNIRFFIV